ncbi:MAG TPA: hypothetical protein VK470_15785 [Bacteroidota bacterium]|nr:hypothetical protein [Bacteroidota bacterium]
MRSRFLILASMVVITTVPWESHTDVSDRPTPGKITVIFTQQVRDYPTWRRTFDQYTKKIKTWRIKVTGIYRDAKNPALVTVIARFENQALLDRLTSHPHYLSALEEAGVKGMPEIKVLRQTLLQ